MKISGPNKSFSSLRHTFETAKSKEEFKRKNTKTIELIAGNSLYANKYYKKNYFDIIVGDLPYGVQHGNVTNERQTSLTRNPTELLNACLPSWLEVLKPKGIITLAWNSNVLPRNKMEQLFEEQGLIVKNDGPYLQFEHKVDQSILRDIIVAQKAL
jgi:tRNA G10  N-methylase Trm11